MTKRFPFINSSIRLSIEPKFQDQGTKLIIACLIKMFAIHLIKRINYRLIIFMFII